MGPRDILRRMLGKAWQDRDEVRIRPRVGVTGSFGRGNYGDELYVKTYQHWLGSWADLHLLTGLPRPPYFSELGDNLVDLMDAVVLGGGDLLCPSKPKVDKDFIDPAYLRRPVHVAGIGVERNRSDINPNVLGQWREFLTNSSIQSITVRDGGSQSWIKEHIQPTVDVGAHPDLVCALPLPAVRRPEGPPVLGLVTRHIKDPKQYVLLEEIAGRLHAEGWRIRHIIGGVRGHGQKDLENAQMLQAPGKETMYSEDLDDISLALGECSLVLSMKLHTTLVATMYGVPTVSVNPVVKAKAFMQSIGREELVLSPTNRKLLTLLENGVPAVPMDQVQRLREEASGYLRSLSERIWDDFRNSSPMRKQMLEPSPQLPGDVPVGKSFAPPPIRPGVLTEKANLQPKS